jgi:hypothetical protein
MACLHMMIYVVTGDDEQRKKTPIGALKKSVLLILVKFGKFLQKDMLWHMHDLFNWNS